MADLAAMTEMAKARTARIQRAVAGLAESEGGAPGLLISDPANRQYATGFTGSAGYGLFTTDRAILLTDFRYVEQAKRQAPGCEIRRHGTPATATLREVAAELGLTRLAFEAEQVSVAERGRLADALPDLELVPTERLIEKLRMVKDDAELRLIEAAVECADEAFARLLASGVVVPGRTEREVAAKLEYEMKMLGAARPSFDTIVASGPRSSLPHGRASDRVMARGDFVTIDFGAEVDGYCSDITRTLVLGGPTAKQREIYDLVLKAQLAGVAAIRPGISGREADAAARDLIVAAGHGEHFGHGLGHGIGLAVHESPRLAPTSDAVLAAGMVSSVEPGIYIPGWGGVRIEDLVVVTDDGCRVLTKTTKQLIEVQ